MEIHASSSRRTEALGALAMVVVALVAWRLAEYFFPQRIPANFTPMLAIALFAGSTLCNRFLAHSVPLAAMVISDMVIGFSILSLLVYALIAASTWLGAQALSVHAGFNRVMVTAFASATGFFIVTNFAVWFFFDLYPHTGAGLLATYVAAIPFYLHGTLAGTIFFASTLFVLRAGLYGNRAPMSPDRLQSARSPTCV